MTKKKQYLEFILENKEKIRTASDWREIRNLFEGRGFTAGIATILAASVIYALRGSKEFAITGSTNTESLSLNSHDGSRYPVIFASALSPERSSFWTYNGIKFLKPTYEKIFRELRQGL